VLTNVTDGQTDAIRWHDRSIVLAWSGKNRGQYFPEFEQNIIIVTDDADSYLLRYTSRYAVWYGRRLSPIGRNVLHCSLRYGFVVRSGSELTCQVIRNFYCQSVSRDDADKARILLELLFVRLGNFRLSNFDVHSLIVALRTE